MTRIAINKVHFPVTTLGYGRRVGIWLQGCSIHCPGCVSRDTWEFRPDQTVATEDLVRGLQGWLAQADGVTVSGGEPFDQPAALDELLAAVRRVCGGDVLVYSGYAREVLLERHAAILNGIDVLISEPYRPEAGTTLALRGSDNQRVTLLTALARARYPLDLDQRCWAGRGLDVMIDGDAVWMAGIPRPGELERLRKKLRDAGLNCGSSEQAVIRA